MDKESNLIFEQYQKVNEDLGLGHATPRKVEITAIGETKPFKRKTQAPVEDEMVYIQAGEQDSEEGCGCGDDCGCGCQGNDGRQIYDDAVREIEELDRELRETYETPPFDLIG